jgi:hypothetical protein
LMQTPNLMGEPTTSSQSGIGVAAARIVEADLRSAQTA